jgi:zinc protease
MLYRPPVVLFSFFLMVLAVPVHASRAFPPVMAGTQFRTLPNGLRLIVREQHGAPLAAIDVWVRAGSGRERANESGAAHFLEHLLFKGTPTRKPGEIDAAIEGLGASLAAGTTRQGAHFYTTVASQFTTTALDVIADAVQNASLSPGEMERERAVILDEIARAENDRQKRATNALCARLFGGHAYGRPVLGEAASVRQLSRDAVAAFYRRWYVPNNTTVVVVGDITPDAAEAAVKKALGGWQRSELPVEQKVSDGAVEFSPPATAAPVAGRIGVGVGVRADARDVKDLATAELVAMLLGGDAGRIRTALDKPADEKPSVVKAGRPAAPVVALPPEVIAECLPLRDALVLAVSVTVEGKRTEEVAQVARAEMRSLQTEAVPPEELDYARNQVIGRVLFDIETYAGQARMLGLHEVLGDYRTALEFVDALKQVRSPDVTAFAVRWLEPARMAQVMVVPAGREGKP